MTDLTNRATILVVDDSTATRCYVCELLVQADYRVVEANDGRGCLAAIEATDPDVVLLDVEMPGMSGLDVLRNTGLKPRLFAIILFTTQGTLEHIAAGLDLGADDYIVKPFQEMELLARIRAAVRNVRHKRNMTQSRRETEAALAQLKNAQQQVVEQEKVAAVARLAAGAAHHINNPLGFVMSNLSSLDRYINALMRHADDLARALRDGGCDPEAAISQSEKTHRVAQIRKDLPCLLQETRDGAQRIAVIIQQLAQLELGLANHGMSELDLVRLLQPLVGMLSVLAPPGTAVNWKVPAGGIMVHGSQTLLNAALVALLKNACEALGDQPGTIDVAVVAQAEVAEISIANSGAGIRTEDLPSLFDPFFTTKTPEDHVGLGLTIAQRFIAGHGGRISLSSDADGTCVKIEVPRVPARHGAAPS